MTSAEARNAVPFWARHANQCECSLCGRREVANFLTGAPEELVRLGWFFHPHTQAMVCKDCVCIIKERA